MQSLLEQWTWGMWIAPLLDCRIIAIHVFFLALVMFLIFDYDDYCRGKVHAVGGLEVKTSQVASAGFTCFIVPHDNEAEVKRLAPEGLTVMGVSSLGDLLIKGFENVPQGLSCVPLITDNSLRLGRATTWTMGIIQKEKKDGGAGEDKGPHKKLVVDSSFASVHVDCAIFPGTGQVLTTGRVRNGSWMWMAVPKVPASNKDLTIACDDFGSTFDHHIP